MSTLLFFHIPLIMLIKYLNVTYYSHILQIAPLKKKKKLHWRTTIKSKLAFVYLCCICGACQDLQKSKLSYVVNLNLRIAHLMTLTFG